MALIADAVAGRSRTGLRTISIVSSLLLGGCASVGDFGRLNSWWPGHEAGVTLAADPYATGAISSFALTDEEKQLRKLAANLLMPPLEQNRWALYASGRGRVGAPPGPTAFDRESYVANLLEGPFRSATSRYARLIDDIRNDQQRMEPFFAAARRVADLDHKRDRSLAHVSVLSDAEVTHTQRRIRENIAVVAAVHAALAERTDAYRFALERLVIALPSPMAAEAERSWSELARRVAEIEVMASPAGTFAGSK